MKSVHSDCYDEIAKLIFFLEYSQKFKSAYDFLILTFQLIVQLNEF